MIKEDGQFRNPKRAKFSKDFSTQSGSGYARSQARLSLRRGRYNNFTSLSPLSNNFGGLCNQPPPDLVTATQPLVAVLVAESPLLLGATELRSA